MLDLIAKSICWSCFSVHFYCSIHLRRFCVSWSFLNSISPHCSCCHLRSSLAEHQCHHEKRRKEGKAKESNTNFTYNLRILLLVRLGMFCCFIVFSFPKSHAECHHPQQQTTRKNWLRTCLNILSFLLQPERHHLQAPKQATTIRPICYFLSENLDISSRSYFLGKLK